ncbi:MAG TPA: LysR substrate-binding domain-containing protein [Flavobacteriales bacterium]|nr:LysR substrate-binding domain-containing protein [Flavobacteriales bacterium]HRO40018.1 LysR substrate-binding domain-containing protein [Flavobacteriales bacterium]HRP81687.1 LysR substrate-binding domain-containing protein [Flavobacteriales bacterium]HRQ86029.1 LysR substrate-binding domain-containing protein [Flavobacteriales bacterium]
MTIQQLQYIVAIDEHRHFGRAAEACFVTQPTLSSMVKKLEEELDVVLFDRSRSPVVSTADGEMIVQQARAVLKEVEVLRTMADSTRQDQNGDLRIGMIPTLAPYLLPLFLGGLLERYPGIRLSVEELTTAEIIDRLVHGRLDVGLLATPLGVAGLREEPLFNERFLLYVSPQEGIGRKQYVLPSEINADRLWLLEEGHCLRSQVLDLCQLRERGAAGGRFAYVSGSIEALMRMVDAQGGLTVVPELATVGMPLAREAGVRAFKAPVPVREISLVSYRHSVKGQLLQMLKDAVQTAVRPHLKRTTDPLVVPVDVVV